MKAWGPLGSVVPTVSATLLHALDRQDEHRAEIGLGYARAVRCVENVLDKTDASSLHALIDTSQYTQILGF